MKALNCKVRSDINGQRDRIESAPQTIGRIDPLRQMSNVNANHCSDPLPSLANRNRSSTIPSASSSVKSALNVVTIPVSGFNATTRQSPRQDLSEGSRFAVASASVRRHRKTAPLPPVGPVTSPRGEKIKSTVPVAARLCTFRCSSS